MSKPLRVLQIVKTTDGASWALNQVKCLISNGIEVHIVLNSESGKFYKDWRNSGATIHILDCKLSPVSPLKTLKSIYSLRKIIKKVSPAIIHSHFFINTIQMRLATFGLNLERVFQVPGPLHLEHIIFRYLDLLTARKNDQWIASSKHIKNLYLRNGVDERRVHLSYYGNDYSNFNKVDKAKEDDTIRTKYNFTKDDIIIGNVCYIYPPKRFIGQKVGLKNHEVMIKAIEIARRTNPRIKGLFIGGEWGNSTAYEDSLRESIPISEKENIIITGKIPPNEAAKGWMNIDYTIHLPLSESCGGVIEPLLSLRPVITCQTGGIPEIIFDKETGYLTSRDNPQDVANKILEVISDEDNANKYTLKGKKLVLDMFDIRRTAKEIVEIYKKIINLDNSYEEYSSKEYLDRMKCNEKI